MTISLKHNYTAVGVEAGDGEVGKTAWNDEHVLTLATGKLLGRSTAGTGAAEEITVGSGLTLNAGTLTAAGTVGGSDTQLQFNDGGAFAGDSGLTFNKTTNALTIGAGTLNMTGSSSGTVTIQPAAAAGTYTLTLPTTDGDNGQALVTDGNGVLSWAAAGGGTPGGSNTQLQFNNSGSFGGASGLTTNGTELTIASGTKTTSAPVLDAAQTWNAGGVTFTGMRFNVTDTASAAASLLMDLQVGGASRLRLSKAGDVTAQRGYFAGEANNQIVLATGTGNSNAAIVWKTGNLFAFTSGSNHDYLNIEAKSIRLDASCRIFPPSSVNGRIRFTNYTDTGYAELQFGSATFETDLFLTRRAAANLRLGAADAAAPVAQTLSVQSVVAGTTNTAGANLTITGSQGTGTGAGGSIIFQVAPAGSSGTAQNALANTFEIFGSADGFRFGLTSSGSKRGQFYLMGNDWVMGSVGDLSAIGSRSFGFTGTGGGGLTLNSGGFLGWTSGSTNPTATGGVTVQTYLYSDAANVLALRNGTNAQTFRVYSTFTDASNYERGALNAGADFIELAAETAGTGDDNLDVRLTPAGTGNVRFGTHSAVGAETVTGYITIKDAGGTIRKLAVIS